MTMDSLTPSALTHALRNSGVLRDAAIVAVQSQQIGQHLGFNGSLWRIVPNYDRVEGEAPTSLIAKFAREASVAEKLDREAKLYRQFDHRLGIRIPRAYVAEPGLLLLEDLSSLKCGDVAAGCSADEALMIVRHLARFHATGWQEPSSRNVEWLGRWPTDPDRFYSRFRRFHPAFLERFRSQLPDAVHDLTLRLVEKVPQVVEELSQAPSTLIHVDTHLDNILMDPPDTVVLIDWPSATIGPAAIDLARFVTASLPVDVRRSIEERPLSEYLDSLQDEGGDYSLVDLRRHIKLAGLRLWAGMVTGYGASYAEELQERQTALQRIEAERVIAVATDWQLSHVLDQL